jgi:large conductance mechanosensitive channel
MRGSVVDLAVGIILGTAFGAIVNSLVNDIIMPPIGQLLGGADFSDYFINLSGGDYSSLAAAQEAGANTLNYGVFINTVITFIVVAFAMFMIVRAMNRLARQEEEAPAEETVDPVLEQQKRLNDTLDRLASALEKQS